METDKELLEERLDTMSTRVQQNTVVVTPEDLGQDFMLHVSKDTNIRKFTPQLTLRGAPSENREVTRVCVSTSLLGCLVGYAAAESDFFTGGIKDSGFRGGFKIYAIPFKAALRPNAKLVYDAKHSDEFWLVTYNKETVEFIPETVGKAFYQSITYIARSGLKPYGYGVLYLEITKDDGIYYSKNHRLEKGYWKVEGMVPQNSSLLDSDKDVKVISISKSEFQSAKSESAALLSYIEPHQLPPSHSW